MPLADSVFLTVIVSEKTEYACKIIFHYFLPIMIALDLGYINPKFWIFHQMKSLWLPRAYQVSHMSLLVSGFLKEANSPS